MHNFAKITALSSLTFLIIFGGYFLAGSAAHGQDDACDFTRDLSIGDRGADVGCLQLHLKARGYFRSGSTNYFGTATREALINWQRSRRITPAQGYFGPISIARYRQISAQTPGLESGRSVTQNSGVSQGSSDIVRDTSGGLARTLILQTRKNLLQKLADIYRQMRVRDSSSDAGSLDNLTDSDDDFESLIVRDTDRDSDGRDHNDQPVLSPRGGSSGGGGGSSSNSDNDNTESSTDNDDGEQQEKDTQAPRITGMQTTSDSSSATLSWATNESTRSTVAFGPTPDYGSTRTDESYDTEHTMTIDSLTSEQTYHYQVTAIDEAGNRTTTADNTFVTDITTDTTAPAITLTAPTDGATVSGNSVQISADASDNRAVAGVSFFVNDSRLGAEDSVSPYEIVWNSDTVADGDCSIFARARDTAGNTTDSDDIAVTVENINEPPTISFTTAPQQNETLAADIGVPLEVSASDPDGSIANVIFSVDDQTIKNDSTAPYEATWQTGQPQEHVLLATAEDDEGAITTTDPLSVRVNTDPTARFSVDPESGSAPLPVVFDAGNSSDPDDNILNYFWDFGDQTGTGTSNETVEHTYSTPGDYTVELRVVDAKDGEGTRTQTITVTDGSAPAAPTNLQASANSEDEIELVWDLSADDASDVSQYVIYSDTDGSPDQELTTVSSGIDSYTHFNLSADTTYHYRIKAEDAAGNLSDYSSEVSARTDPAPDTTAPDITNIAVSADTRSATISWDTNEPADSRVNYGITDSYGDSESSGADTTTHSLSLNNLTPGTVYHYEVVSVDAAGNSQDSSDRVFGTKEEQSSGGADSRAGDEAALEALYASTNGGGWDNNTGWSSSGMSLSDNIYGVETEMVSGELRVKTIKLNGTVGWETQQEHGVDGVLGGNNLTGTLPEEIGNLKEVVYFNVKNNEMSGSIPVEIGDMESLRYLYLNGRLFDINLSIANHPGKPPGGTGAVDRSNNFTGSLPTTIGDLSNLEILIAEGSGRYNDGETGLTGPIPDSFNNLGNLKAFYLNYNSLTDFPTDISNLDSVTHFSMGDNNMNGVQIPATLSQMISIEYIWLDVMGAATDGEGLTGGIPDLSGLKDLNLAVLPGNSLTGDFPDYLIDGTIPAIDVVVLRGNDLTGTLPAVGNDIDLYVLDISYNNIGGPIPASIWQEQQIRLLSIGWNDFTGGIPQSGYPDYDELKTVYFNNNNLTGDIPCEFWQKLENPTLGWLYFNGTNNWSDICESEFNNLEGRGTINSDYDPGSVEGARTTSLRVGLETLRQKFLEMLEALKGR